jgi:outer membrane protein assembly factor BamB
MAKKNHLALALLMLLTVACGSLPTFPTPIRATGRHVSGLTLYNGDLYFGAGYCLYHLDTQSKALNEILCTSDWTFQRPAVNAEKAYVQVITGLEGAHFFACIDLAAGTIDWRSTDFLGIPDRSMKDYTFLANDQVITIQSEMQEQRICAFDTGSGEQKWCTEPNYFISHTIPFLIQDDSIWYVIERQEEYDTQNGQLAAVDLKTGQVQQIIDLRPNIKFDDLLYVNAEWILGWEDRHTFAIGRQNPNEVTWYSELSTKYSSDQIFLEGEVFIVDGTRKAYALDKETGQTKWEFPPNTRTNLPNADTIIPIVLISDESQILYALDAVSGTAVWQFSLESEGTSTGYAWQPDSLLRPVMNKDTVYIANESTINALDLNTGDLVWKVDVRSEYMFYQDPLANP